MGRGSHKQRLRLPGACMGKEGRKASAPPPWPSASPSSSSPKSNDLLAAQQLRSPPSPPPPYSTPLAKVQPGCLGRVPPAAVRSGVLATGTIASPRVAREGERRRGRPLVNRRRSSGGFLCPPRGRSLVASSLGRASDATLGDSQCRLLAEGPRALVRPRGELRTKRSPSRQKGMLLASQQRRGSTTGTQPVPQLEFRPQYSETKGRGARKERTDEVRGAEPWIWAPCETHGQRRRSAESRTEIVAPRGGAGAGPRPYQGLYDYRYGRDLIDAPGSLNVDHGLPGPLCKRQPGSIDTKSPSTMGHGRRREESWPKLLPGVTGGVALPPLRLQNVRLPVERTEWRSAPSMSGNPDKRTSISLIVFAART